jgi:hypothetical protein
MRVPKPETMLILAVTVLMLSGLILQFSGLAPRVGTWLSLVAIGLACVPMLLFVAVTIFEKWRA